MPRPIRVEFPNAYYWISNQSNASLPIFKENSIAELFIQTLEECIENFKLNLFAYSVSPTGYSLFLQTPSNNLTESIGWLQTTSSIRINRFTRSRGHVFSGRYKAILVSPELYARQIISTIHFEPFIQPYELDLPSGIRKKLSEYPHSTHQSYGRRQERHAYVTYDFLSDFTDINNSLSNDYESYMEAVCREGFLPDLRAEIRSSLVLGSDELLNRVRAEISRKSGLMESKWLRSEESRQWAEQIAQGIPDNLGRDLKIWIRASIGHERPTQLAREFGFSDTSGVTHLLKKIRKQLKTDTALAEQIASLTATLESNLPDPALRTREKFQKKQKPAFNQSETSTRQGMNSILEPAKVQMPDTTPIETDGLPASLL